MNDTTEIEPPRHYELSDDLVGAIMDTCLIKL
jgi:hypothetical protein